MSSQDQKHRSHLPMPNTGKKGLITFDAKDPASKFPPIERLRPPKGAPNVLIVLIDDVGFGATSAFGGPCQTPTAEKLAAGGLKFTRFHTTALCSPTRQALLTGRNHHSVGMGGITEIATGAPGYCSVLPNSMSPLARTLKLNGYSTAQFGKCHEVPVWETSPAGPFDAWPTGGGGFEYFYGFIGGEANQWYPTLYEGTTSVEPEKTPEEGYHLVEDMTDKAIQLDRPAEEPRPRQAVLHLLRARRDARAAPRAEGMGRQVQGQVRSEAGTSCARRRSPGRRSWASSPPTASSRRATRRFRRGTTCRKGSSRCCAGRWRCTRASWSTPITMSGRLFDSLTKLGIADDTLIYYIAGDNGASAEGSLNGCYNEMSYFNGLQALETPGVPHGPDRQARWPGVVQPLRRRLGARDEHTVPVDQAGRLALGRDAQRHHRPLAEGHQGQGRDPLAVQPRHRRRADDPRSGGHPRAALGERPGAVPDRRRQHALCVQRRQGGGAARDAVLRDVRQPRHLPPGLDGGDEAHLPLVEGKAAGARR